MQLTNSEKDLTPYFKRPRKDDRLAIPNNVKIVVGTETFECAGCILANNSEVFSDLIQTQDEIYLDGFVDCLEGLLDAIDILYGGKVELTMDNIQAVLKFSLIYKIHDMIDECLVWAAKQLKMSNLFAFCKMGLFMLSIDDQCDDVMSDCKSFINMVTAEDLLEASKTWPDDENVIMFLIDEEVLKVTLPTVTHWIDSEENAVMVLDKLENSDLQEALMKNCSQFLLLVAKMNEFCETVATLKRIIILQTATTSLKDKVYTDLVEKVERPVAVVRFDSIDVLKKLKSKAWRTFSKDEISSLDFHYKIEHFFYLEILLDWIRFTKPPQEVVDEFWNSVRPECVNAKYISSLRDSITTLECKYVIPDVPNSCQSHQFRAVGAYPLSETAKSKLKKSAVKKEISMQWPTCQMDGCSVGTQHELIFRLTDATPCYQLGVEERTASGHYHYEKLKHCYATEEVDGNRVMLSFATNSLAEALDKIKDSTNINLEFLFEH